jgi:hypothetical protein
MYIHKLNSHTYYSSKFDNNNPLKKNRHLSSFTVVDDEIGHEYFCTKPINHGVCFPHDIILESYTVKRQG